MVICRLFILDEIGEDTLFIFDKLETFFAKIFTIINIKLLSYTGVFVKSYIK